jgi:hypothetical protein
MLTGFSNTEAAVNLRKVFRYPWASYVHPVLSVTHRYILWNVCVSLLGHSVSFTRM